MFPAYSRFCPFPLGKGSQLVYDLAPLAELQLDMLITSLDEVLLNWLDGRCVQGAGTYSANDSDVRLLGIPAS